MLTAAGFESPSIEPTRVYTRDDAVALLQGTGLDASLADEVEGCIMSAFVRATKPGVAGARPKLARALPTATPAPSSRACGCDDGCCT